MWYRPYFDDFDPLEGTFDDELPGQQVADQWLERARKIIRPLEASSISNAIDLVDWVFLEEFELPRQLRELEELANESGGSEIEARCREAKKLSKITEEIDLKDNEIDPALRWSHLYAVVGINLLIDAWQDDLYELSHEPVIFEETQDAYRANLALRNFASAIEVISMAELATQSEAMEGKIDQKVKEKISDRNRKAGFQRHAKTEKLKRDFIKYWFNEFDREAHGDNRSEAARRFYREVPKADRILSPSNYVVTLTKALKAHLDRTK